MADLLQQVYEVSPRFETKAEIVNYYQGRYPGLGKNGWKQHLVHDLLPFTPQTGKDPVKNLSKRFDSGAKGGKEPRLNNPEPRNRAQYQALGETLPPKGIPGRGYHIYGTIYVKFSEGGCEEREVDEYIEGEEAQELLRQASADMAQMVLSHYMEDALWNEPSARIGDCNPPDLHVDPIE